MPLGLSVSEFIRLDYHHPILDLLDHDSKLECFPKLSFSPLPFSRCKLELYTYIYGQASANICVKTFPVGNGAEGGGDPGGGGGGGRGRGDGRDGECRQPRGVGAKLSADKYLLDTYPRGLLQ